MDVGSMSVTGLISQDFDIQSAITQLGKIKSRPISRLEQEKSVYSERLSAFQQLTARTLSLSTAASGLTDGTAFSQVSATSSDDSAVVVSASAGAPVGTYDITVDQLARSHKVGSQSLSSSSEALGLSGDILVNGTVVNIGVEDTLADISSAINAAGAGVSASILNVSDGDCRLHLTSLSTGTEGAIELADANTSDVLEALGLQNSTTSVKHTITDGAASDAMASKLSPVGDVLGLDNAQSGTIQVNGTDVAIDLSTDSLEDIAASINAVTDVTASVETVTEDDQTAYRLQITGAAGRPTFTDDNNVLATLGVLQKGFTNEIDAAQDAQFSIDGISMTRSTNAIDDAIENLQLQLQSETGGSSVAVSVEADTSATVAAVEGFVGAYNEVIDFINQHQNFDSEAEQGGLFFGSPAVMNLEAGLRDQVSDLVDTMPGDTKLASQIGLRFNSSDQLQLDTAQLLDTLASDPEGVKRMFGVRTEATDAGVQVTDYSSATQDSGAAGWDVEITQAATRATATSASLSGGITTDEMLTVNGASVSLSAGMTLEEAADQLNALFQAQRMDVTASVDGDSLVMQNDLYGDAHALDISSSLADGAGGTDLGGAAAGDVATYEGRDVAGTIDGETATGNGRVLTGAEDTATEGLQLVVSTESPGSAGVVRISKGIASRLGDYIEAVTDDNGSLTRATEGVTGDIQAVEEEIAEVEDDVDRYIAQLQSDFAVMETKMSQSQTLLNWMQNQMTTLSGSSSAQ